ESGRRLWPEARRGHLPRVLVFRLAEEERARLEFQGLRIALREDLSGRRRVVPLDRPCLQEQPEQAGGVGIHAVHQQRQGRHGSSPGAGNTSGLDGEPRQRLREVATGLSVDKSDARAAGATDILPSEIERARYGLWRGRRWGPFRQGTAQAPA